MSKVYLHLSMSLDGFITGPNEGADDEGLERLHAWMFDGKTNADAEIVDHVYSRTGAVLIGRRMFDVGVEPWARQGMDRRDGSGRACAELSIARTGRAARLASARLS